MKVGLPFREALGNFADELDDPDVDFFCEVLALNRELRFCTQSNAGITFHDAA